MKELASGVAFARDADFVLIQYKKVKETYPQHDIIIASPRNTICNYAGLENIKSIYKPKPGYFFRPPTSTQPTKILLILHQRHLEDFKSVLDLPHSDRFHESNGWHFFIVNVDEAI